MIDKHEIQDEETNDRSYKSQADNVIALLSITVLAVVLVSAVGFMREAPPALTLGAPTLTTASLSLPPPLQSKWH